MATTPQSPAGKLLTRRARHRIEAAMADSRVVLVTGPRQAGKSTLVAQVARDRDMPRYSLGDPDTHRAACDDEIGFLRAAPSMVIDEIQRNPEMLLTITAPGAESLAPGRFLLTGGARTPGLRTPPGAPGGRLETMTLWPLSQGEIDGGPDGFVDAAFALGPHLRHESAETHAGYVARIVRGGFPAAVGSSPRRRAAFLSEYVGDLVDRDIAPFADIGRGPGMRALIDAVASRSGRLLVPGDLARTSGMSPHTVKRYLTLLEEVHLIRRIPALARSLGTRQTGQPRVVVVDSGVAAALARASEASLRADDGPFGGLLDGFVAMEIARQITWSENAVTMSHYRTRDQIEVGLVLETPLGEVVAVDVRASPAVGPEDFRGLRHLEDRLGDDFVAGFVLHTGGRTHSFGPRLRALPISALWEVAGPRA